MAHLTASDRFLQQAIPNGCAAKAMGPSQRRQLGVMALAGSDSISHLAADHRVSRKFVHRQVDIAADALDGAFAPKKPDDKVLFHLPVTKAWLEQFVLALLLCCHSSYRGVIELLRDVFGLSMSLGSIHNIVSLAAAKARVFNSRQDLANVRVGVHDEIFQSNRPVLVGVDADSTYCYLLSQEDQRDGDTWALHVMELMDRGLAPDNFIADAGGGLRAGMAQALPDTPCHSDVFHALQEAAAVVRVLENRAYEAMACALKLEKRWASLDRRGLRNISLSTSLRHAHAKQTRAIAAADTVALLVGWLRHDVLGLVGPSHADRQALYDFILRELESCAEGAPQSMKVLTRYLTNQRDDLLAFAAQLDRDFAALAERFEVAPQIVREVFATRAMNARHPGRYRREAALMRQLGRRYHPLGQAVDLVRKQTVRASSVVENLNSRLRSYFFLRRHLGNGYLALLQFFLNHRCFMRSEHPERVGRSPAELLTGQPHDHWLEKLGYQRWQHN